MDYYNQIKNELLNNEIYKRVKDYSKNKNELLTYYNVGKILIEAQGGEKNNNLGNNIIKNYSKKLESDLGKRYNERTLRRMRQFYVKYKNIVWSTMSTILNLSHFQELLSIKDQCEIYYYIKVTSESNLTVR